MNNYCNWTIPYAISLTNILLTIAIITMCLADNNDCTVLMIVNIVYLIYYITFAIIVVVLYLIYVKSIRRIIEIAFIIFLIYAVASIFYILITYVSVFVTSCHSNFILIFCLDRHCMAILYYDFHINDYILSVV